MRSKVEYGGRALWERLREPGPTCAARVAERLANGLAADPLFFDLLAYLHLLLEDEVDLDRGCPDQADQRRCGDIACGCDRAGVVAAGALGRTRRPSRRLPIGGSFVADRSLAAGADRRLARDRRSHPSGSSIPPRAHPTADRYLRRFPLRFDCAKHNLTT